MATRFRTIAEIFTSTIKPIAGIIGKSDGAAVTAGNVGETIESVSALSNYPGTATYGDGASIPLTAGKWSISAVSASSINGATCSAVALGISSTAGNFSTGLVTGSTFVNAPPPAAAYNIGQAIPAVIVNLNSSVTYYAKVLAVFTAGNPQYLTRITAIRIG